MMRLSWNEISARAGKFSDKWKDAHYEKGETQSFYNAFFDVFGISGRGFFHYEYRVKKIDNQIGYIDLIWLGKLLVEQKSAGGDLKKALKQAADYCINLKEFEQPHHLLASDFQNFILFDLDEGKETSFKLADLHEHVEAFSFILGIKKRTFRDQATVNIKASELMGDIHDELKDAGYRGHDLEQFLVRLVFCLFADNTGIFETNIFLEYLEQRTSEDGSDLGAKLSQFFQVLNTPEDERQDNLDESLNQFPYVNGDLFRDQLSIPSFNAAMRKRLIAACEFNWSRVSPAIFGSLFQSVMESQKRRAEGAHYTSEKNILKVIEPLFMDELRKEFERIKKRKTNRKKELRAFQERLGKLTFFDPACGCGNFLIIAYRELRRLELEVLKAIYPTSQRELDVDFLSKIDVDQFYGIEFSEFPCRIAETALWMMDHIMNNELSLVFGQFFARIPLKKSPHILHADALETDWNTHIPAAQCDYVFGNPPFGGSKYQAKEQRTQIRRIAALGGSGGSLDYVAGWFLKAGEYVQKSRTQIAFVATNSLTQGEQVGMLWPLLFDRYKLKTAFAHRTFSWQSEARGKAHVHVVIIGLTRHDMEQKEKRLFSYPDIKGDPDETRHKALSPYLFDASQLANQHLVVREEARPINGLPQMIIGSQPIDGGHYIFTEEQKENFLEIEPQAKKFLHPYIGSREHLQGGDRWILALQDASPNELRILPEVRNRISAVRKFRETSKRQSTLRLAETPTLYQVNSIPDKPFLLVPRISSERRDYVPIGWLKPPTIPSDAACFVPNASLDSFGILTSAMHMAWMRCVGGRLESRYRYSIGVVYNTFPMPKMTERQKEAIGKKAQVVLDARAAHKNSNLADLYDRDLMLPNLRKAHSDLDRAVDRLYRRTPFNSERERVEHLFTLYEQMASPLTAPPKKRRRKSPKT